MQLEATPVQGSVFGGWQGNCSGGTHTTEVFLAADMYCYAVFDDAGSGGVVTAGKLGGATGIVTSEPDGIECDYECQEDSAAFEIGDTVELTAAAHPDAEFVGWSGRCSGTQPTYSWQLEGDATCEAAFEEAGANMRTLAVSVAGTGSGTVTGPGINCGADCIEAYTPGTYVELIAAAVGGSEFSHWEDDCSGTNGTISVHMDTSKACRAVFTSVAPERTLHLLKAGHGEGTVVSDPADLQCLPSCQEAYATWADGTLVELIATPEPDSEFVLWSGDCTGSSMTTEIWMTEDKECYAEFSPEDPELLTVQVLIAGPGEGEPVVEIDPGNYACSDECTEGFLHGSTVTLTATGDGNREFLRWEGDCEGKPNPASVVMSGPRLCIGVFKCLDGPAQCTGGP